MRSTAVLLLRAGCAPLEGGGGGWRRVGRRASRVCSRQAGGKAGKDSGKTKTKAVSRSQRAGLQVSGEGCG